MSKTNTTRRLASIIIPCWSQLEFTRQCIRALRQHTRPPWELIVVDNGSTDGTAQYLAGLHDGAAVPVTVIGNATNRGFPAAINQGLQVARGEYLVLLNNDVVVTDGWLDQLVALANAKAERETGLAAADATKGLKSGSDTTIVDSEELAESERGLGAAFPPESDRRSGAGNDRGSDATAPQESDRGLGAGNDRGSDATAPPESDRGLGAGNDRGSDATATPESDRGLGAAPPPPLAPPSQGGERCAGAVHKPRIGLVGPMSNYAVPPQLVADVPYRDMAEMHEFARRWRDEHRGRWLTVPKLSGFCLLMKREVYDAVGGLDERFGLGFFDDDDLAERARRAGFTLAVARDLFVHHFGSRTFAGNGIDAEKLLDENARRFAAKWGRAAPDGRRVALSPWSSLPAFFAESQREFARKVDENELGGGKTSVAGPSVPHHANGQPVIAPPDPRRRHPDRVAPATQPLKVSLTMIVRDEEENLPRCLESVRGLFDEIVVVDTGSTDRTVEIARSFGAKVFGFVWVDDFAAARNESLRHATGDYAFWLDGDDILEPAEREKLAAILQRLRPGDEAAYVVRCACNPAPDTVAGDTVVDHVRLFPIRDGLRWKYRVHEQILPSLNRAKVPVRWTDIAVRHTGYADPEVQAHKLERNIRLLELDLEEQPGEPFILFNLGSSAVERRQWPAALGFLERSLAGSAPADSIVRKLYALIARVHQMLGDSRAALRTCEEGLRLDPEDAELWFRKAVVHRHRGESTDAGSCWRRILTLRRPDEFCSFDQAIYSHLTHRNLAVLAAERGDHVEAERLWREVLAECPGDREALAKLDRPPRLGRDRRS